MLCMLYVEVYFINGSRHKRTTSVLKKVDGGFSLKTESQTIAGVRNKYGLPFLINLLRINTILYSILV